MSTVAVPEFGWDTVAPHTNAYIFPAVRSLMPTHVRGLRVLDVGCGNGTFSAGLIDEGCRVVGVDVSPQGVEAARQQFPKGRWEVIAADRDMLEQLREEPFDLVISTEVVEHLYAPRDWARGCFAALKPGGRMICSTPYHGYLKNLMLSVFDKWDSHASPLWDGGHIKLWSRKTLGRLLTEVGFTNLQFRGAGRLPYLWMAMAMSGDKPK